MTRDEAIAIAKQAAWDAEPRPSYVPIIPSKAEWDAWMPHEWVVGAVLKAAQTAAHEPNAKPHPYAKQLAEWIADTRKRIWVWRKPHYPHDAQERWEMLDPRVISSVYAMTTKHVMVVQELQPSEPGWTLPGYDASADRERASRHAAAAPWIE